MAIAYSSVTLSATDPNNTSTSVDFPASPPAGAAWLVVGAKDDDVAWSGVPSGWGTAIFDVSEAAQCRLTAWLFADDAPTDPDTISHDNESTEFAVILITGADTADLLEAVNTDQSVGNDAGPINCPSVTPTNSNTLVFRIGMVDARTITNGAANNIVDIDAGDTQQVGLAISWEAGPAGGNPTGAATDFTIGGTDGWIGATVAVNEDAGGAAATHPGWMQSKGGWW